MKKLILILSILVCSIAAIAQGPNSFGGVALRVNDTTTYQTNAAAFHTAGYYDIYFNNQATNDHWDVWNGSSYDHIFAFGQGSGTGVTDGDKGDITVSASGVTWTVDAAVITFAKIQNIAGLSIFGRSANSSGVGADITAGTDNQVLRRSGTTIGFGQVNLSSSDAVTGTLPLTRQEKFLEYWVTDELTPIGAGTNKITVRTPFAMTVTSCRCSLVTAQASGTIFTVDIHENGTTILSTKITIDNTEETSTTALAAPVISDSSIADDSELTFDIDQIGNGSATGLKCKLIGN